MGITVTDIKIRQSQRLTDNPDGGGRMVAAEVIDGQMNNLFPDISTQDRVSGRVSMRKAFMHIDTPTTDVLYGAVGVLMEPPDDDNVTMLMFSTGSYADVRSDARNRIENYVTRGVESRYVLFGDHFIGQRAITVYCLKDAPSPDINDTYCLSVEKAGYPANVQFVRVEEVISRSTQTFVDNEVQFERDVIVFTITTSLQYDFIGQEVDRRTSEKPPTRIRQTNVADASSYYGLRKTTLSAAIGDLGVKVSSPYAPLVPSTQAETPVVDVLAGLGTLSFVVSGAAGSLTDAFNRSFTAGGAVTRYLGTPFAKGQVTVTAAGTVLRDNGRGDLVADGGASPWSGTVDYFGGAITISHANGTGSSSIAITATPAGAVSAQGYTQQTDVTASNRQNNYIFQAVPLPSAGTVTVDYRALGKWIRLYDTGSGQLAGAPGQGSGSINYSTGSIVVTLGALPDLDSAVIVSFGTGIQVERRDGDIAIQPPSLQFTLPDDGIKPGSVSVAWMVGGNPMTAIDDGAGLMKIGSTVVGWIVYATGDVSVRPTALPDTASQVTATYVWSDLTRETFTPALASGIATIDLGAPVRPGALRLSWTVSVPSGTQENGYVSRLVALTVRDDGAGNLVGVSAGGAAWTESVGTVNYGTGLVTVRVSGNSIANVRVPTYDWIFANRIGSYRYRVTGYTMQSQNGTAPSGTPVVVEWQDSAAGDTAASSSIELPPVELDLTPSVIDSIVPGAVRFEFRGRTYVDRGGSLFYNVDPASGSGTYGGSIDYATGRAGIASWSAGGANAVSIKSLLTRFTDPGMDGIFFRTPGAPLRPGSFTLRATTLNGVQLTALADINGVISGAGVDGKVDWQSGAAYVRFGQMVTAAGNESEPWYDPAQVVGGLVWKPTLVLPETVFFGTVVYRSIPLNPALLGLDPVRLPQDGRVVIFKPGQTALLHHTQTHEIATPAAGQVVPFGRPYVARVEVRDSLGVPVLSTWYTIDKAAGTLTFSDPLNLSAYTLPIVIRERIEDRVLIADAQITGEIAFNRPLAHAYPSGATLSTCLILGEMNGSQDIQARVENLFDQQTWTGVFSDERIGNQTDAQYNDVVYPLLVDNRNAITERWAIHFTSGSAFEVIGESSGIIATGTTAQDCAPLNPRTTLPYFTIRKEGWGAGWSTGNVVRFNTIGGLAPVWFIRTTLAGEIEVPYDGFRYEVIGDAAP